jgi:hypothetical protein
MRWSTRTRTGRDGSFYRMTGEALPATVDAGSVVAVARDHAWHRPSAPRGGWVIAIGPPVPASSADRSARGAEMASRFRAPVPRTQGRAT